MAENNPPVNPPNPAIAEGPLTYAQVMQAVMAASQQQQQQQIQPRVVAPAFSGAETELRAANQFLRDFLAYCTNANMLTPDRMWPALGYSLRGAAKEWYHNYPLIYGEGKPDWETWSDKFNKRFGKSASQAILDKEGRGLRQQAKEPALDFLQRCLTVALTRLQSADNGNDWKIWVSQIPGEKPGEDNYNKVRSQMYSQAVAQYTAAEAFLTGCAPKLAEELKRRSYTCIDTFMHEIQQAEETLIAGGSYTTQQASSISSVHATEAVAAAAAKPKGKGKGKKPVGSDTSSPKAQTYRCPHCRKNNHTWEICFHNPDRRATAKNPTAGYGSTSSSSPAPGFGVSELCQYISTLEAALNMQQQPEANAEQTPF